MGWASTPSSTFLDRLTWLWCLSTSSSPSSTYPAWCGTRPVPTRPVRWRSLEPGSNETPAVKAWVRAKVEHPFQRVMRLFGHVKSLPEHHRGCATGAGEERGAAGAAVRAGQPAQSEGSTEGVVRPAGGPTRHSRPSLESNGAVWATSVSYG